MVLNVFSFPFCGTAAGHFCVVVLLVSRGSLWELESRLDSTWEGEALLRPFAVGKEDDFKQGRVNVFTSAVGSDCLCESQLGGSRGEMPVGGNSLRWAAV